MADRQEFRFPSADGTTSLYGQIWLPEGEPRGVIQIVHGISEYGGRYAPVAEYFNGQGFVVAAEDHLGHGYTPEDPADLGFTAEQDGWTRMTDNVRAFQVLLQEKFPGLPYVLWGHSMGSFLARSYLIRYPGTVDLCVLEGTGQQPGAVVSAGILACKMERKRRGMRNPSPLLAGMAFGSYNKRTANRTPSDWISSVDAEVDRYRSDPLCQIQASTTLMLDMMTGIRFIQQKDHLAKMDPKTPVFFVAGEEDPVGSYGKGVKQAYQSFLAAGCTDVSVRLYPGARHEVHNDFCREEFLGDVLRWIDDRIKG